MQMLIMIKNQLKLLFNNRLAILGIIAAPLLLTYLFSFSQGNSKTNLYIADSSESAYSKQLITMIEKHDDINIIKLTEDEITKKVDKNTITAGFIIENNFGDDLISNENLDIKIVENYESSDGVLLKQVILSEAATLKKIIKDSNTISKGLSLSNSDVSSSLFKNIDEPMNISITDNTSTTSNHNQAVSTKLIGFLAMFLWFVVIQGFRTLIEEKENNSFRRILSTSISHGKYIASKIIATLLFGSMVTLVIVLTGQYAFNINIINNFPLGILMLLIYLFSLTGLIMIFVPFVKKQQTFTVIGAIIMALTGILGGSFFQIDEIASNTILFISKFTPEFWIIKSLTDINVSNASIFTELPSIIALTAAGIIGLILSYILLNMKIKTESI